MGSWVPPSTLEHPTSRAAARALVTESLVAVADMALSRDTVAVRSRISGWKAAGGQPRRKVPAGAVDHEIGFVESLRLRVPSGETCTSCDLRAGVDHVFVQMHIGLNLIYLVPGETGGMETYARELIPGLVAEHPELRITAFVNAEAYGQEGPWSGHVPVVKVPVQASKRTQWVRGEQLLLPRLAAHAGIDLLHSLGSTSPGVGAISRRSHDPGRDLPHLPPEAHSRIRSRADESLLHPALRAPRTADHRSVAQTHAPILSVSCMSHRTRSTSFR